VTEFTVEGFVRDMRGIAAGQDAPNVLRAYMDRLMAAPDAVREAFPPELTGDQILFEDDTVSVWRTSFEPGVSVPAHDHRMSAVICVYQGEERNDFYEADPQGGVRRSGQVVLAKGSVLSVGPSAIHSVTCTSDEPALGLHVYLGNLTKQERTLYDIDSGTAMPFDDANYEKLMAADRYS
jgi:predicted metal-dependent enzyme (double-stranded beta helix superfamily)